MEDLFSNVKELSTCRSCVIDNAEGFLLWLKINSNIIRRVH